MLEFALISVGALSQMWFVYLFQIADALTTANLYKQDLQAHLWEKRIVYADLALG